MVPQPVDLVRREDTTGYHVPVAVEVLLRRNAHHGESMGRRVMLFQARSAQGVDCLTQPRLLSPPTYWRCEPGWSWRARPLTDHLLWYVLGGIGWLTVGRQEYELAPGNGVVFAPGDEPVAGHDPRRRLLVFGMHFEPGAG